uniref:Ankyrin repeat and SOCS box containing 18 n=1 Tax=Myotis lucifugus TaxID=59463 RepID=G1PIE0_MYOLU
MSSSDCLPDHPLSSDLVRRLKSALDARDEETVRTVICTQVRHVDAVIELANDDWMKDPSAQLPPGVLLGFLSLLKDFFIQFRQNIMLIIYIPKIFFMKLYSNPLDYLASCLWTLEYTRELTTPLCIAAARGHAACVHPAGRGADPNASPEAWPLHEAAWGPTLGQLLLRPRRPDLVGLEAAEGAHLWGRPLSPKCAQALLEHGASVHRAGGAGPGHAAARGGAGPQCARGSEGSAAARTASDPTCRRGSAALRARARPSPCTRLCLGAGRRRTRPTRTSSSPLHKACGHARPGLALLLLRARGRRGRARLRKAPRPWARVLQAAACAPQAAPQRTVQALLNHGSPTLWPDAFPKVLQTCAPAPAVIEVLFNAYPQLRVSESWREVIPEEVFQAHRPFYQSLFALAGSPRRLLHLCRCAIRRRFGKQCSRLVPLLPLPATLQSYLLLEPEGVLH